MYAVIFRATIAGFDNEYSQIAEKMRELALKHYACVEFTSVLEGDKEIAISYWENEAQIKAWKHDSQHILAQELGKSKWYKSYKVQVVKIVREYVGNT